MMRLKFGFLIYSLAIAFAACINAASPADIRWANGKEDIARIDSILASLNNSETRSPGALTLSAAKAFLDVPYVAGTLEGDKELLTIDTKRLDCTTLVELSAALAKAALDDEASANDVADNLRELRYRRGKVDGYASRLHYISDWITDNTYLGLVTEVTKDAPGAKRRVETLNFMTRNRDKYPALADSASYAAQAEAESGLRGLSTYYIPKSTVAFKDVSDFLRDGDIIFITTTVPGLDVAHAGIIAKDEQGMPHLLNASSTKGKVILDPQALDRYLSRINSFSGIRIVRLKK